MKEGRKSLMSQIVKLIQVVVILIFLMGASFTVSRILINGKYTYFTEKTWIAPANSTYRVFVMHCNEPKIPKFNAPTVVLQCVNETNGCNEAIPYIKAIYDWYDKMQEDNFIFVHSHIVSWHQSNIEIDVENTVKTEYFRKTEYGGFPGGIWKKGCDRPFFHEIYSYMYHDIKGMPSDWNRWGVYPCCATFFVKTSTIRKRPRSDYKEILDRSLEWVRTKQDIGKRCGGLFEFTWHLLFTGKQVILPPKNYKKKYMFNAKPATSENETGICLFNNSTM